jgi:[ribosomal protein S5]-alanine N-acetyltransferase
VDRSIELGGYRYRRPLRDPECVVRVVIGERIMRNKRGRAIAAARVLLRRPMLSDGDEVIEMNRRSKKLHRPWLYAPMDGQSWAVYVERLESERHHGSLVCLRDTGAIVGVINMSEIVQGIFQSAYLGYYAGAAYAGQGYMTEGLRLVVSHAFKRLKLHRLEANIQPGNRRSRALVRRLGFHKEGYSPRYLKIGGRWRDHERWAITAEDWRAAK